MRVVISFRWLHASRAVPSEEAIRGGGAKGADSGLAARLASARRPTSRIIVRVGMTTAQPGRVKVAHPAGGYTEKTLSQVQTPSQTRRKTLVAVRTLPLDLANQRRASISYIQSHGRWRRCGGQTAGPLFGVEEA